LHSIASLIVYSTSNGVFVSVINLGSFFGLNFT
jgi:hypothetical protein